MKNKENMKIDDFTMVILTHRCPHMLANLLDLYAAQRIEFLIVVADSSAAHVQEENATTIARHGNRVRHAQFAPDCDPFVKFYTVPDLVETPFGMYAADDDVVILSGLIEALEFLRSNSDYVACHGIYYSATLSDPKALNLDVSYSVASHDLPDPFARVLSLSLRYQSLFYSLMRRETLLSARVPKSIRNNHFFEMFNSFRIIIEGKVCGLQTPFIVRNSLHGDVSRQCLDRDPTVWIVKDSESFWIEGYLPVRSELSAALAPHLTGGSATHLVDIAYATFFARVYSVDQLFATLTDSGRLTPTCSRTLRHLGCLNNAAQQPSEEVIRVVRYLVERGWPDYG